MLGKAGGGRPATISPDGTVITKLLNPTRKGLRMLRLIMI